MQIEIKNYKFSDDEYKFIKFFLQKHKYINNSSGTYFNLHPNARHCIKKNFVFYVIKILSLNDEAYMMALIEDIHKYHSLMEIYFKRLRHGNKRNSDYDLYQYLYANGMLTKGQYYAYQNSKILSQKKGNIKKRMTYATTLFDALLNKDVVFLKDLMKQIQDFVVIFNEKERKRAEGQRKKEIARLKKEAKINNKS